MHVTFFIMRENSESLQVTTSATSWPHGSSIPTILQHQPNQQAASSEAPLTLWTFHLSKHMRGKHKLITWFSSRSSSACIRSTAKVHPSVPNVLCIWWAQCSVAHAANVNESLLQIAITRRKNMLWASSTEESLRWWPRYKDARFPLVERSAPKMEIFNMINHFNTALLCRTAIAGL